MVTNFSQFSISPDRTDISGRKILSVMTSSSPVNVYWTIRSLLDSIPITETTQEDLYVVKPHTEALTGYARYADGLPKEAVFQKIAVKLVNHDKLEEEFLSKVLRTPPFLSGEGADIISMLDYALQLEYADNLRGASHSALILWVNQRCPLLVLISGKPMRFAVRNSRFRAGLYFPDDSIKVITVSPSQISAFTAMEREAHFSKITLRTGWTPS